jgi:hypothetical protein
MIGRAQADRTGLQEREPMKKRKTAATRIPAPIQPARSARRFGLAPVLVAIVGVYAAIWYTTRQDDSFVVQTWGCMCSDGSYCAVHNVGRRPAWLFRLGVVPHVSDALVTTPPGGSTHYIRDESGEVIALVCGRGTPIITRDKPRFLRT